MKKQKLTGWYPVSIKPVREGVYQVQTPGFISNKWSHWNGRYFSACTMEHREQPTGFQSSDMRRPGAEWRGMAK